MFSIQHYSIVTEYMAGMSECFRVFYIALLYSHRVYGWRVRVFSCFLCRITLVTEYMAGMSECFRVFYIALLYSH